MKRIIYGILLFCIMLPFNVFAVDFDLNSTNALLYNLNDDSILFEKNKDSKVAIASLTKIMTCIVALEHIDNLDDKVILNNADFKGLYEANASVAGFKVGEEVTYRDLLYGLMLPSGADAALALTNNIAGGEEEFVELMNNKANELKLRNTHFVNPTGLDIDNHYSSVSDVIKLFKYAIMNEEFVNIISASKYVTSNERLTLTSTISKSLNRYGITMDYLIGGQTGTTGNAGLCLATISEYDSVKYMLVTTGASMDVVAGSFKDQKTIYEYFMNNFGYKNVVSKGDLLVKIPTKYAKDDYVNIKANTTIKKYLSNDFDKDKVEFKYDGIDTIKYNMKKNDKLGTIDVIYDGQVLDKIAVLLPKSQKFALNKFLIDNIFIVIGGLILIILVSIFIVFKVKKKSV